MKKSKLMSAYKLHEVRMWLVQVVIPAIGLYLTVQPLRERINCKARAIKCKIDNFVYKLKH